MMNIEEEKEIVEKMKKKGNSEVEYAEGMSLRSVLPIWRTMCAWKPTVWVSVRTM